MTDSPVGPAAEAGQANRPYSPGLEGVIAGETNLGYVDGEHGRLLYRGYRIGDLVAHGTFPAVANLLWTGEWDPAHRLATGPVPDAVLAVLRSLLATMKPMDALRTAVSVWGSSRDLSWPPTVEQARALTAFSPSALAAFVRLRAGRGADRPRSLARSRRGLPLPADGPAARSRDRAGARRLLHRRRRARLQRLDVHRPGHHLDPLGHRLGGDRRDRGDEGAAPRRRPARGRRPAGAGSARPTTPRPGSATRSTAASG